MRLGLPPAGPRRLLARVFLVFLFAGVLWAPLGDAAVTTFRHSDVVAPGVSAVAVEPNRYRIADLETGDVIHGLITWSDPNARLFYEIGAPSPSRCTDDRMSCTPCRNEIVSASRSHVEFQYTVYTGGRHAIAVYPVLASEHVPYEIVLTVVSAEPRAIWHFTDPRSVMFGTMVCDLVATKW